MLEVKFKNIFVLLFYVIFIHYSIIIIFDCILNILGFFKYKQIQQY